MNPAQPNKKNTLYMIFGVILLLTLGFFFFQSSSGSSSSGGIQATELTSLGSSELALLSKVRSIRIDTEFFKKQSFKSLVDYSVMIPEERVGRPNPFAPIPGVANPNTQTNPN